MNNRTVGPKEGLGAGIFGLGLLLAFLPSASQKIADLEFVGSEAYGILLGAVLVISLLVMAAGYAVFNGDFSDEE
jgi:hypothetical protein